MTRPPFAWLKNTLLVLGFLLLTAAVAISVIHISGLQSIVGTPGTNGQGIVGPSGAPGISIQGAGGAGGGAGANGVSVNGKDGTNGRDGLNGRDGQSVTVTQLPAGDPNCSSNGGVRIVSVSGTSYVCNGGTGPSGPPGPSATPVVP